MSGMQHWSLTEAPHDPDRAGPEVLFSTPEARGVLIDLASGAELGEHRVRERAIIQVLRGRVELACGAETTVCERGTLVVLEPHEPHAVRALEQAQLLLILAPWPAPGHYDAAEHEDPHELPAHATRQPG
jgi:quercetin dioxygenase-like cupin family protein